LQLLSDPNYLGGTETNRLDQIVTKLKELARHWNTHILLVSSLSRGQVGDEPSSKNLRGSQGIAYSADNVVILNKLDDGKNFVWFKVAKQRNGPSGKYLLKWEGEKLLFRDATQEEEDKLNRDISMKGHF